MTITIGKIIQVGKWCCTHSISLWSFWFLRQLFTLSFPTISILFRFFQLVTGSSSSFPNFPGSNSLFLVLVCTLCVTHNESILKTFLTYKNPLWSRYCGTGRSSVTLFEIPDILCSVNFLFREISLRSTNRKNENYQLDRINHLIFVKFREQKPIFGKSHKQVDIVYKLFHNLRYN